MSKVYERLDERLRAFIGAQKMFFVASAPLNDQGNVNLSPKGYDSFKIIDDLTVAYVDLGGSGVETLAHIRQNGRVTLMFMAMNGPANILRLYGRGEAVSVGEAGFEAAMALFPDFTRARSVITVHISRIADSCGWGIPIYDFVEDREQLRRWVDNKPEDEWLERRYATNEVSIDGLPGLARPK
jgi:hypothetical protein